MGPNPWVSKSLGFFLSARDPDVLRDALILRFLFHRTYTKRCRTGVASPKKWSKVWDWDKCHKNKSSQHDVGLVFLMLLRWKDVFVQSVFLFFSCKPSILLGRCLSLLLSFSRCKPSILLSSISVIQGL